AFQPLGRESPNVIGLLVKGCEVERKLFRIKQARRLISNQRQLFQIAVTALEGDRMVASAEIEPRHVKRYSSANAGGTLRVRHSAGLPGLHFQAKAVIKSVAPRFRNLEVEIFVGGIAVRVLHRYIDFVKNSQIIEAALGIEHLALAQSVTAADPDFTLHHERTGIVKPGNENLVHKYLRPFSDLVSQVNFVGVAC